MAILSQSSSDWILSLRVVLISTSVLFAAMILKLSAPAVIEFAYSEIPYIWSFVASWFRPPYLYVVINCIIITIVASSKLQRKVVDVSPPEMVVQPVPSKVSADYAGVYDGVEVKSVPVDVQPEFVYGYDVNAVKGLDLDGFEQVDARIPEMETGTTLEVVAPEDVRIQDELAISRSWTPPPKSADYSLSSFEKPPVSGRIGHRRSVKFGTGGGWTLGVSKPKRHETLENTWKTITEGRGMPLARHLRKSDTWETHGRVDHLQVYDQAMTKSETFNDHATATALNPPPGTLRREGSELGKLKREPSPSQDELNRRVEAFIRKFNEEMRLQRQESLNQYMEMINRGAH